MATELAHPADYSPLSGAAGSLLNSIPGRLTAILAVLLLLAQTLPAAKFFANPAHYLPLHIVFEFIAITISGMVAGLAWNLRERQPNSHRMILGAGFLAVCWIDVAHTLSYAGMPDLVTVSGPEKAINFWLAGRLVAAGTLLAIALSEPRQWSKTACRLTVAIALGVIGLIAWIGLFHDAWLPRTFIAGQGLTPFKVNTEYFLAVAYGTAGLLFYRHARRSGNADWLWLAAAALIQGLAELFFTLYADVTDLFNLLGHVYKAVAYVMVYRALFVSGVQAPYRELDAERDRLTESEQHFRTLANNGSALIWTSGIDKACNYFNDPWLRYTGRTIEQELGYGWSQGIHPDDFEACLNTYTTHFDQRTPFVIEYRLRHADGHFGWVRDEGTPRFDSHGNFIGYIGFCYDISSLKATESELAQHRDRLEQLVLDRTRELTAKNQERHAQGRHRVSGIPLHAARPGDRRQALLPAARYQDRGEIRQAVRGGQVVQHRRSVRWLGHGAEDAFCRRRRVRPDPGALTRRQRGAGFG